VLYYLEAWAEMGETETVNHSDPVVSMDHGKRCLQASQTVTVQADGKERETSKSISLAEAKCNRDTYNILKNTFASELNQAFNHIKDSGYKVSIYRKREGGEIYSKLGADPDKMRRTTWFFK
jgi:hypothetical protein